MRSMAATLSTRRADVAQEAPHWEGEKRKFQTERVAALRQHLAAELPEIEQQLVKGGEFRGEERLDDVYLTRWLRARYWNLENAAQSIRDHAVWRLAYCPHQGRIPTDTIGNELATEKMCLQGLDKKGRTVLLVRAARHSMLTRDADEVERLLCYAIDRQLDLADTSLNPHRKTCVLFDLTDIGLTALDVTAMHQVYTMLSQHFVERLGKLFIFNAPIIFWATWRGFSTVIPKESLDRIEFVYPSDLEPLHAGIPTEILPASYQGTGKYIPIQNYGC